MTLVSTAQSTQEHILKVATRLFSARGFANVSIRDICDEAGVTAPTVYHYYGNKEALFQAVVRTNLSLNCFRQYLIETVESQSSPVEQLALFIRTYLTDFPRQFFNPGMFLQDSTTVYDTSTFQVMGEFEAINALARRIFLAGMQDGSFRKLDADEMVLFLMNMLMAYVLGEVHYQQPRATYQTAQFLQDLILTGICRTQ
ncbi:MAG: TetR/AcrR family transcriptional regulator [Chloroflexi bacterium]|nr:TetR/AcrR family transcriptional regulator [Chloroflexota bacterium]